jgi:hypothetical protein
LPWTQHDSFRLSVATGGSPGGPHAGAAVPFDEPTPTSISYPWVLAGGGEIPHVVRFGRTGFGLAVLDG